MGRHINELAGRGNGVEGSLCRRLGGSDEGHDGTVGVSPSINIEQFDAVDNGYLCCDRIDDRLIATFAEIGNTLNESHDSSSDSMSSRSLPRLYRPQPGAFLADSN